MTPSKRRRAPGSGSSALGVAFSMAEMMIEQWLRRGSGILTAARGKLKRLLCFEEGSLVFVASNVVEEQVGPFLLRDGLLSRADLERYEREAVDRGVKVSGVVAESGTIDAAALEQSLAKRIGTLVSETLEWPAGELRFDRGVPKLDGEVPAPVSPVRLLIDHARQRPATADALRVRLGRPDLPIHRRPERLEELDELQLDEALESVLQRCTSTRTIGELLGPSGDDLMATMRALYALRLLGVLRSGTEVEAADGAADRPLSREEVMARVVKADGADHYQVLGLDRGAPPNEIRSAYYQLARRMHPDRFRTGELRDLLDSIEHYFSQVTEAYNTLSDRELRKAYDAELEKTSAAKAREAAESDTTFLARQNFLRGQALVQAKRYNEALQFLQNAVDLDGTQSRYFLALGLLQSRNPRLRDEAEQNLLRVTQIEPTAIVAYLSLGNLYRRAGRPDQAATMYREALRWDPGNREASEALSSLGAA